MKFQKYSGQFRGPSLLSFVNLNVRKDFVLEFHLNR